MWEDFWEAVWRGFGEALGAATFKALLTEKGRKVLGEILGVIFVIILFGFSLFVIIYNTSDWGTINRIKGWCEGYWDNHIEYGRMYNTSEKLLASDSDYEYIALPYSTYSNVAMFYVKPQKADKKSYVALVFARSSKQKNYACNICASDKNNADWAYPVHKSDGLYCPDSYSSVSHIDRD